jgi:hypothetical protein
MAFVILFGLLSSTLLNMTVVPGGLAVGTSQHNAQGDYMTPTPTMRPRNLYALSCMLILVKTTERSRDLHRSSELGHPKIPSFRA